MHRGKTFLFALAVLSAAACGKKPEPVQPAPAINQDSLRMAREAEDRARLERARQDSIARAEAAARAAAEEMDRSARATLSEMVFFEYDQFGIRNDAADVLRRKVDVLQANPDVALRIIGHADERGSVEYNLALGMRRANAVREFLTGFNLDPSRFSLESMGEEQPLDAGQSEDAYARNRRAEFQVTAGPTLLRGGR